LNIALQSPFPPYRGGIATFGRYMLEHLQNRNGAGTVNGINFRRLYPPLLFPGSSQYTEPPVFLPGVQDVVHSYNPFSWKHAAVKINALKPDVYVYTHWHPFFCASQLSIIGKLRALHPGIRVAGLLHNVIPHEGFPFQHRLSTALFKQTDIPFVLSSQTQSEYTGLLPDSKPVRLYHPVYEQDLPATSRSTLRDRFGVQPDETALLFFGLIRPYKGLDVLLRALHGIDLHKNKIRLFIAGEFYTKRDPYDELLEASGSERITLIDRFVRDDEAAELMTLCDAMVLPYRSASQSGILSNAINFGLPVIASNLPGLSDQVVHGKTGLLVEAGGVDSLRDALMAIKQPDMLERMRTNTLKLKKQYSWTRFAQLLLDHLNN